MTECPIYGVPSSHTRGLSRDAQNYQMAPTAELAIAACECGWGCDLTFLYQGGKFVGWRRDGEDRVHEPYRQRIGPPAHERSVLVASLTCRDCGREIGVIGGEESATTGDESPWLVPGPEGPER